MIRKEFNNTLKPYYYIFTNFELGDIPFEFRGIFKNFFGLGFQIIMYRF
jgi:hypothetical protein